MCEKVTHCDRCNTLALDGLFHFKGEWLCCACRYGTPMKSVTSIPTAPTAKKPDLAHYDQDPT